MLNQVHNTITADTPLNPIFLRTGADISNKNIIDFERIIPHPNSYKMLERTFGEDATYRGTILETIIRLNEILSGEPNHKIKLHPKIANAPDVGYLSSLTFSTNFEEAAKCTRCFIQCVQNEKYRTNLVRKIERFYEETNVLSGLNLNRNLWGTMSNATEGHVYMEGGVAQSIIFDTIWNRPMPIMRKLSQMFPDTTFTIQSSNKDLGGTQVEMLFKGGEIISETIAENAAPFKSLAFMYDFFFTDAINDAINKLDCCIAQFRVETLNQIFPNFTDCYGYIRTTANPEEFKITCNEEILPPINETFTVEGKFNKEELKAKIIKVIEESWDCRLVCRPDRL